MTSPRTAFSAYLAAQDAVARSPTSARAQRALARARDAYVASAAQPDPATTPDPAATPTPAPPYPYTPHTPRRRGGNPENLVRARAALRLARLARASPST